ncbi:MAG: alpha/beta hydrolase [Acidimicrobiia bacterium]
MAEPDHIDAIVLPSGRRLEARVHRPAPGSPDLRTAVIQVHGGGWRIGSPAMLARRSDALARRGFTAIAVAYRLLDEAPWPAALQDVRSAVRWVRANAERLGVDPERIVLQGHSAGGHLALLTAGGQDDTVAGDAYHPEIAATVAAVVAFYPPTDLRGGGERLLGTGHRAEEAAAASPITRVHGGFPPTLLVHGLADTMVAPASSEAMHRALLDAGATSELHLFAGQIHEFDAAVSMCELTQELAANFVARHLLDPARFEAEQAADNPLWPR